MNVGPSETPPRRIRSVARRECTICGSEGNVLYDQISDRLYSAPETWRYRKCVDAECGLIWLDPMPIAEDLGVAYDDYFTHADPGTRLGGRSLFHRVLYGAFGLIVRAIGIAAERAKLERSYLDDMKPGRVLEIGCGDGSRLLRLRAAGWDVVGQEVDPGANAFTLAQQGIQLHSGDVFGLGLPEQGFDAIVMNHVIEHVSDPLLLFIECRRLLRPGGRLVAVTPNSRSAGASRFGRSWLAYDAPRHLHVFAPGNLAHLARKASFAKVTTATTCANSYGVAIASMDIDAGGRHVLGSPTRLSRAMRGAIFQVLAKMRLAIDPNSGEECVLTAEK